MSVSLVLFVIAIIRVKIPESKEEDRMKKQTLSGTVFIAALIVFSMAFAPAVLAGDTTHTITIVNNSNTPLSPDRSRQMVIYSIDSTCLPPGVYCCQANLNPPNKIAAHSSAVLSMTGPTGCKVSQWQSYWYPDIEREKGDIHCTVNPANICNSINKDYTCTISQANVDAALTGRDVMALAR